MQSPESGREGAAPSSAPSPVMTPAAAARFTSAPYARYRVAPYRLVRSAVELLFAAAYVVAVYELVVAGGIALWPTATDDWILPMWIAAAALSGLGLKPVRALARSLLRRLWPSGAADPYATLAAFVAGRSAAEPAEAALSRLAQLAVTGTGARSASVWLVEPSGGLRLGGRWPDGDPHVLGVAAESPADLGALAALPGVDHLVTVLDAGELFGALTLTAPSSRSLTPGDLRLAGDVANAAGQLLRNAELTARLAAQLSRQSEQAAELDRSRRRVLAARDAAREQLGREIQARVGEPLLQCSAIVSALLDAEDDAADSAPSAEAGDAASARQALVEMTTLIDTAIGDFRRIVHGVFPAVLTDHGLAAALDNLLADLPRRTAFTAQDLPRVASRVEAGVYLCVAALIGALPTTEDERPLELLVGIDAGRLTVVVHDPACPVTATGAQPGESGVLDVVRDRVAALEGEVATTIGEDGLRHRLTVPVSSGDTVAVSSGDAVAVNTEMQEVGRR
jgi:signal transduction histidine kinase